MTDQILVVVDMQNDFIDGALGTPEAAAIVGRVAEKIRARRAEGYRIFLTMDTHTPDYPHTQEGKKLPVPHCIRGTRGWRLNDKIAAEAEGGTVFEKGTFGSRELFAALERERPAVVEFAGVCTDICVVSNALGAKTFLPESRIVVDGQCCAGTTAQNHEAAILTMKSCQIEIL